MKAVICPHGISPKNRCKECKIEYDRAYFQKNKVKRRKQNRLWKVQNPEKLCELREKWLGKDAKRNLFYYHAYKYPLAPECELCSEGSVRSRDYGHILERHHPDYDYPEIFITVCTSCHYYANRSTEEVNKIIYKWIFIVNVPMLVREKNMSKQMSVEIWLASTGTFVIDNKSRPKGIYI